MIMRLVGIFGQLRTTDCCRHPEGEDELSRILKKRHINFLSRQILRTGLFFTRRLMLVVVRRYPRRAVEQLDQRLR